MSKREKGHFLAQKRVVGAWEKGEEREREREKGKIKYFSLLSKIYRNRNVGLRRSKRQSRSMHRELHMGTKILEFCQTPRGREFSYLEYF